MRDSIEPEDIIYVKGHRFLSFAKNMNKNLSNKYCQKFLDTAKKSTTDAIKPASKRAIQKTAKATGDFFGNKIADKITNLSKKYSGLIQNDETNDEIVVLKEMYIPSEKRQEIIDKFRFA